MMKVVFLITLMFVLVVVHGWNRRPCQRNPDNNAYNNFVHRNIVRGCFNRRSRFRWTRYLRRNGLCSRKWQTFIESRDHGRVLQICNGYGRPVYHGSQGDLCISNSTMLVYGVRLSRCGHCRVASVVLRVQPVVVACDMVGYQCLPVSLKWYTNQRPNLCAAPCRRGC